MNLEESLRKQLHHYPAEKVDQLLARVCVIWRLAQIVPRPPTDAARLKKLQRLAKSTKAFCESVLRDEIIEALGEGEPIGRGVGLMSRAIVEGDMLGKLFAHPVSVEHSAPAGGAAAEDSGDELGKAWRAVLDPVRCLARVLRDEIERLERSERRGTKPADADGKLAEIACAWRDLLGEAPTATMGGPFYNFAELLLQQTNVERPVRAAIVALKTK